MLIYYALKRVKIQNTKFISEPRRLLLSFALYFKTYKINTIGEKVKLLILSSSLQILSLFEKKKKKEKDFKLIKLTFVSSISFFIRFEFVVLKILFFFSL